MQLGWIDFSKTERNKILSVLEHDKKISVGERRLLHNARQILQSEIMLIKDIDAAQAEAWIRGCC
jgi:CarD family transcriptional regulator